MTLRNFWFRLILPIAFSAGLATAQSPAPATFQSENKSVTIERFDPKAAGSHPAVIVVHGGGGAQGDWRKSGLLETLTDAGYIAFVPHYFEGTGGSWTRSANADQLIAYIRTLNDAARFVAEQPGVQKDGIGLLGISLGGYAVLALTEEENSHPPPQPSPAIKAVIEMYAGMPEFAAERMTTMPPVLILHGQDDNLIPVSNASDLEKLLQKKSVLYEMKIYPHQGHGFEGDVLADANQRIVAFLKAHL
jgi:dipeptidyl aminopeptidase/acylaminoacyl peptidase